MKGKQLLLPLFFLQQQQYVESYILHPCSGRTECEPLDYQEIPFYPYIIDEDEGQRVTELESGNNKTKSPAVTLLSSQHLTHSTILSSTRTGV